MSTKHEYLQVSDVEYTDDLKESSDAPLLEQREVTPFDNVKRPSRLRSLLAAVLISIAIFLSGLAVGSAIPRPFKEMVIAHIHPHSDAGYATTELVNGVDTEGFQCGNTWEEAKTLGCKFDVMASRWYSPECFFQEVLDGFMAEPWVNFTWYYDEDHTEVFPSDKAMAGEFVHVYPDNCKLIHSCCDLRPLAP